MLETAAANSASVDVSVTSGIAETDVFNLVNTFTSAVL